MVLEMVGSIKVEEDGHMEKMQDTKINEENIPETKFSFLFVLNALCVKIVKKSR
jgi:hypothetical protein